MMFPDAAAAAIAYLNPLLTADGDTARASGGIPNPRPARLVRCVTTGSTRTDEAYRNARVTVEAWAASETDAERLADKVHGWLCDMDTDQGWVPQGREGWLGGPYSQEDPISGSPRYVQTVIIRQRIL